MKVSNMEGRTGRPVANQFILTGMNPGQFFCGTDHKSGRGFQSYDSLVAFIDYQGNVYLDKDTWDYSPTTGKYRNQFLGEDKKTTEKKIESGEYKLVKMN